MELLRAFDQARRALEYLVRSRRLKKIMSFSAATIALLLLGLSTFGVPHALEAASANPSQEEWTRTLKAAEQEGQLVLYANEGIEGSIQDFQKRFPPTCPGAACAERNYDEVVVLNLQPYQN